MTYKVQLVDALFDGEQWVYNETSNIGCFTTCAKNPRKAFTDYLRKHLHLKVSQSSMFIETDCDDNMEVMLRGTCCPVLRAVGVEESDT